MRQFNPAIACKRALGYGWRVLECVLAWLPAALLLAPLTLLALGSVAEHWDSGGPRGFTLQAFQTAWKFSGKSAVFSVTMALAVATITALLAVPVAYLLLRGAPRVRRLLNPLVFLPAVLPSMLIAMGLIMALPGLHGGWGLLLLAYIVQSLPFAVWPVLAGLQLVDVEQLEKAGRVLGASTRQRLLWLVFPNAARPAAIGGISVFVLVLAESSTSFFLASGAYQPFGVTLYNAFQDLDIRIAAASTMMLIALLSPAVLALELWLARKPAGRRVAPVLAVPQLART